MNTAPERARHMPEGIHRKAWPGMRWLTGSLALYGLWSLAWLLHYRDTLNPTYTFGEIPWVFLGLYAAVTLVSAAATVSHHDWLVRGSLAVSCITFVALISAESTDTIPFERQFDDIALAGLGAAITAVLLASPLRKWPDLSELPGRWG